MLNKSSGVNDYLNGQDWEKTKEEIWEYQEGQKWIHLVLLWDIAFAIGQSNTNASQCLSHYSLLATSHTWLLKT